MVATSMLECDLRTRVFRNLMPWTRGVDIDQLHPFETAVFPETLPRPVFVNVGRMAVEKNVEALLALERRATPAGKLP
jgi:hypothetical protein